MRAALGGRVAVLGALRTASAWPKSLWQQSYNNHNHRLAEEAVQERGAAVSPGSRDVLGVKGRSGLAEARIVQRKQADAARGERQIWLERAAGPEGLWRCSPLPPRSPVAPVPTTPPRRSTPTRPRRCSPTPTPCRSRGNFEDAAKKFEDLDRDHPYSPEARRAIVMAAYAYYKAGKLPEAIASAERYTTLHPGTKEAPLAHHIIASAYFDDIKQPDRDQTRRARRWPS